MKEITITTTVGQIRFIGRYLPERQCPNWHYYEDDGSNIYHFRKEHMVFVIEEDLPARKG